MREKAQKLEESQSEQVLKRPVSRFGVGEAAASNLLSTWAREEQVSVLSFYFYLFPIYYT